MKPINIIRPNEVSGKDDGAVKNGSFMLPV
jgi:hypothetical protein